MRLLLYSCPILVLLASVGIDAQLLAPLMSLAGGLASNLNPFQGIASSLTGGVGSGGGSGLRGGLLSSLRGAASNGIGFSALPGGVRNMPLMPGPVPAPSLPPFAGFGSSSNIQYGQQMPMLTPEELAEIMQSQSQASPAEFDSFGNAAPHEPPKNKPPQQQLHHHNRGYNNPPPQSLPQYQPSNNPPAYSQPQGSGNFGPPPNSYQGNRDNDYNNGSYNDDDGNEEDHRGNDDSEPNDYNAVRPPVRRPQYSNQQFNNNNHNNNRYRAPPSNNANFDGPVGDRDQDRDYNQYDAPPPPLRGNNNYNSNNNNNNNYRGPRNENAPVVRGYRVRSPSHDEKEVSSNSRPYARPQETRPEQGNRYLQGGFTPVSAAGGFDGPPDRPVNHNVNNNAGARQNTRPQSGRSSQHYYNSMHDQKPRDDRDSSDDVEDDHDGRMESYGRSPSEPHPQAAYGYYNKDEYAADEADDYDRRRRRRTNNSRY